MGILSKIFGRSGSEPMPLHHPRLGELRWHDEGWWEGVWGGDGETSLEFSVAGDRNAPSEDLVTALEATLGRWREVNQKLRHFLTSQMPHSAANTVELLRPTGVDYLWPARPDYFVIDLELEGDDGAIWRVEFAQGEPKHLGRDD